MTDGADSGNPPDGKAPPPEPRKPLPKLDAPFPTAPTAKPGMPQPTPTGEILPIDHPLSASSKRLVPTPPTLGARRSGTTVDAPLAPLPALPGRPARDCGCARGEAGAPGPTARGRAPPGRPASVPYHPPRPLAPRSPPGTAPSSRPAPAPDLASGSPASRLAPPCSPWNPAVPVTPIHWAFPGRPPPAASAHPFPPPLPPMTETSLGIPVMPMETEAAPLPALGISIAPVSAPVATPASPPPTAPEDPGDRVAWKAERLDMLDYFELLGISTDASAAVVKRAFYTESRAYHPDRFFHLTDEAFKAQVHEVYKRVTEAYFVLRDDTRRRKYLDDVTGPDRARKLRFDELSEKES